MAEIDTRTAPHLREHVVIMGVAGSGKTTLARLLAARADAVFLEGDDLHPPANRRKMSAGTPLANEDRWPWLDLIAARMTQAPAPLVVTCSLLKRAYRERLRARCLAPLRIVYLDLAPERVAERIGSREGHFMKPEMLASQLADLEIPGADEGVLSLHADAAPEELRERLVRDLLRSGAAGAASEA